MRLTAKERHQIEVFAKETARRRYLERNEDATDIEARQFAHRFWRQQEFVDVGIEIVATFRAMDENEAAPNN